MVMLSAGCVCRTDRKMAHVLVKLCVTYHQLYLVLVVISTLSYDITTNFDIISKLKANQSRFKAYC